VTLAVRIIGKGITGTKRITPKSKIHDRDATRERPANL